ncbi:MAG TPA: histidine phosphatase family protein [Chitinophagaceae bacterium]|nr:histidine phosphatase family protein [Chitinophagaceae bacterium]
MKTILLIRHAKAEPDNPSLKDFDRPLAERGKKDASVMAQRLISRKINPEVFISSPAKRAKSTALLMARELGYPEERILWKPELYHGGIAIHLDLISRIEDKFEVAALFSHNPGISMFADSLTPYEIENIPTCGIFMVKAHAGSWIRFQAAEKEMVFFEFPKMET